MATSGTVTLSTNQDALIRRSMRLLGLIKTGGTRQPEEMNDAAEALNVMLKEWDAQGVGLWLIKSVTLYPQKSTASFDLGPSGDNATLSGVNTETSTTASSGASTIDVDSVTGMTAADNIGVELESGSFQFTTIVSISTLEITLTDVLTDDVADGATVVAYTTKIDRPLRIANPRWKQSNTYERPLDLWSRSQYMEMPNKETDADGPNSLYYDPQLTNGKLFIWPRCGNVDGQILFDAQMPTEIMIARSDEPLVADEWYNAVAYNLAATLAPEYPYEVSERKWIMIEQKADALFTKLKRWDEEVTSLFLSPKRWF